MTAKIEPENGRHPLVDEKVKRALLSRFTKVVVGMVAVAVLIGLVTIAFGSGYDDERYRDFDQVWTNVSLAIMIGVIAWWAGGTNGGALDRFAGAIRGALLVVAVYAVTVVAPFVLIPPERCGSEGCNNLEMVFVILGIALLGGAPSITLLVLHFAESVRLASKRRTVVRRESGE
jgi:hypothetical protein